MVLRAWCGRLALLASLLLGGLSLAGCTNDHAVVVQLLTDFTPGVDFDAVVVRATGFREVRQAPREALRGGAVELTTLQGVQPGASLLVEVELQHGGARLVSRRVQQTIDRDRILLVVITRNCLDVSCPSASAPRATECLAGTCITPECGGEGACAAECVASSDCTSATSCARPTCADGVCVAVPDSTRCPTGETCSTTLGCVPSSTPGDLDAGALDAGGSPDAFTPDAFTPDAFTPDAFVPGPTYAVRRMTPGATTWASVETMGVVPTEPLEAVVGLYDAGQFLVFTASYVFVFEPSTRNFASRHIRDAVFPQLRGVRLGGGAGGRDSGGRYEAQITAQYPQHTWKFTWTTLASAVTQTDYIDAADRGAGWETPLAPRGDLDGYTIFHENPGGWATQAASSPCTGIGINAYWLFLTSTGFGPGGLDVSIFHGSGGCNQFVNKGSYGSSVYPPFRLPNTADEYLIRGVAWDGSALWLFSDP